MGFNVTCTPGKDAVAGMVFVTPELPALVMYLDPVNMSIQLPPYLEGPAVLARFCRELSREAGQLAEHLEPVRGS
jgi:hypothetical protein